MPMNVITRDKSSGRYHRRMSVNGRLYVDERCNLDQAGAYDTLKKIPGDADVKDLCGHCFPGQTGLEALAGEEGTDA